MRDEVYVYTHNGSDTHLADEASCPHHIKAQCRRQLLQPAPHLNCTYDDDDRGLVSVIGIQRRSRGVWAMAQTKLHEFGSQGALADKRLLT